MSSYEIYSADEIIKLMESIDNNEHLTEKIHQLQQCALALRTYYDVEGGSSCYLFSEKNLKRLVNAVQSVIHASLIPPFDNRDYFSYSEEDFESFAEIGEVVLSLIYELINFAFQCSSQHDSGSTAASEVALHSTDLNCSWLYPNQLELMILLAAHLKENLWSSSNTQLISKDLLSQLFVIHNVSNVDELLSLVLSHESESHCNADTMGIMDERSCLKNKSSLLSQIMLFCKLRLGKEQWQRNPFLAEAFTWIVLNTQLPHLSDHIDQIMAVALNFIDDHQVVNKVRGIEIVHHLLMNTSAEEMRWFNRAEVIYESLKHQLYSREACVLELLLSCLLRLLQILEPGNDHNKKDHHHDVFETLLRETQSENRLNIRRVYVSQLKSFTDQVGVGCVRHLQTLVEVIEQYLEVEDGPQDQARYGALALLHTVIVVGWPRIYHHAQRIVQFLLKFLLEINQPERDIPKGSKNIKLDMNQQVVIILHLLKQAVPEMQACFSTLKDTGSLQYLEPILKEI